MSKSELWDLLNDLGWSLGELADAARRDNSMTRKMASGARPVDDDLAKWLRSVHGLLANGAPPLSREYIEADQKARLERRK